MKSTDVKWFSKKLLTWNREQNNRNMPWKGEKNPYYIWLSEIILQQTRVEQGWDYYLKFKRHYPKVSDLANAPEDEVLSLWQGLGYYSRARNLHHTAKIIQSEKHGKFPDTHQDLLKLKGIGPYTAAAIASFAYNLPHAVVDGNVVRILSRVFQIKDAFDSPLGKKVFTQWADDCLDKKEAAAYNQAIMDFGATVCTPLQPQCSACPMRKNCRAFLNDAVNDYPTKTKKPEKKNRYFVFSVITKGDKILIEKRKDNDIWKGLYQLPLIETDAKKFNGLESEVYKQTLTHQKILAKFVPGTPPKTISDTQVWADVKCLNSYGFPKIIATFIESIHFKNR